MISSKIRCFLLTQVQHNVFKVSTIFKDYKSQFQHSTSPIAVCQVDTTISCDVTETEFLCTPTGMTVKSHLHNSRLHCMNRLRMVTFCLKYLLFSISNRLRTFPQLYLIVRS